MSAEAARPKKSKVLPTQIANKALETTQYSSMGKVGYKVVYKAAEE